MDGRRPVVCPTCGSVRIRIVDTSRSDDGTYHGGICENGHAMHLITTLLRKAKTPWVRQRYKPARRPT